MQHVFERPRYLAVAAVLALVTSACSVGSQAGGGASGATIAFDSPSDGMTVSVPFQVKLNSSLPLGEPETGNHHAHIYFDTISTNQADYDIVYGTSEMVTRPLSAGQHTLIVALANPDHSLAGPQQQITVTVSGDGAPGTSPTVAPTQPAY